MVTRPLIRTLDARKAAQRQQSVEGSLQPGQLERFSPLLANDTGTITAELGFFLDEERRCRVRVQARATVNVVCQRCLNDLAVDLHVDNTPAVVVSDEQARQLPRSIEPLVTESPDELSLWDVVEEELILALPAFSYHDTEQCNQTLAAYRSPTASEPVEEERPNPFDVLAQLRPDDETRS
jgi:uncharacterized protein